jgi:hypothetical protein
VALVVGRRERERVCEPAARQLAGRLERPGARALAPPRAAAQQRDLEQQQLLERQPPAPALVVAEVGGVERGGAVGQPLDRAQPRRQRLERLLRGAAPLARQREDLRRGQPVGGGIGGHLAVGGADRLAGRRVERDAEAVAALVLALQQQPRPRPVLALEPRLIEERRLHRPGGIGHHRLDQRLHPPAADRARADRAHLDDHRRRLLQRQLADRARRLAVARQVLEQVADRVQPEPLGAPGGRGGRDLERRGEPRRPRVARRAGGVEGVVGERLGGGEAPDHDSDCDRLAGRPRPYARPPGGVHSAAMSHQ